MKNVTLIAVVAFGAAALVGCSSKEGTAASQAQSTDVAAQSRGGSASGEHHGRGPGRLKHFDANGDGKIQLSELPPEMAEHLGKADTNKDGVLDKDEMKVFHETHRAEMRAKYDTNKDGKLDAEEMKALHEARGKEMFARADKNGDGAISAAEASERKWAHLSVADADGSGSVTFAEIEAARASGKLKMGPRHPRGWGRGEGDHGGPGGPGGPGGSGGLGHGPDEDDDDDE